MRSTEIPLTTRIGKLMAAIAIAGMTSTASAFPIMVKNGNDSGEESLRAALQSGATQIYISGDVTEIVIDSPLLYEGTEALKIIGAGTTIRANATVADDFNLLEVANGANLAIERINFRGLGGFDFANAGDGKGIFVSVPSDRTGVVRLELTDVRVQGVANHGIHVSDCTLGDDCGAGSGGGGDGSPASIHLTALGVHVNDVGNGKFDADGIRVDERADGGIMFDAKFSIFSNVGADGIELDEGNDGDVWIDVSNSLLMDNGGYCLPAPLDVAEPCVEDDDSELVLDLDDGFDIDEAGAGELSGKVNSLLVISNLDEGLDFDEEGPGGVNLDVRRVDGLFNGDEAFKVSSANEGNVIVVMRRMNATDNGNDGIQIEAEDGDGQVHVEFRDGTSRNNDGDGLDISQENTTDPGTFKFVGFADVDSVDLENVNEIE